MEPRRNCARLASVAEAPVHLIPHRRRRRHRPHRSSPFYEAEVEDVVLVLGGVQIQKHTRRLYVWRSNLTEGAPEDQVFQRLEPILVDSQQPQIRLTVRVNEIYTVTTLSTGRKGSHDSQRAGTAAGGGDLTMPLPYSDDFEAPSYRLYQPPKLFYDRQGAWEIDTSRHGRAGRVMRQVTNTTPVCWGSCGYNGTTFEGPLTALGPAWGDSHYAAGMSISFDVFLEAEARLELRLGRAHGVQL